MPSNSGFQVWVKAAFGEFWAFQISYWVVTATAINAAVYPVIAYLTMFKAVETTIPFVMSYLFKIMLVIVFTIPNLFKLEIVGNGLFILGVLVLLPFVVLIAVSVPQANWSILLEGDRNPVTVDGISNIVRYIYTNFFFNFSNILYVILLFLIPSHLCVISIIFWNMSGMDCIATVAGEVHKPEKTLPTALIFATLLVVISMCIPLCVATAVGISFPSIISFISFKVIFHQLLKIFFYFSMCLLCVLSFILSLSLYSLSFSLSLYFSPSLFLSLSLSFSFSLSPPTHSLFFSL